MEGPGIPGWFVAFGFIIVLSGIVTTVWRVSAARNMARRAGLDQDDAVATALLTQNGLDATYIAANLRPQYHGPAPTQGTAESRLKQLKSLLDQGLVTQAEYDERRAAILAEI